MRLSRDDDETLRRNLSKSISKNPYKSQNESQKIFKNPYLTLILFKWVFPHFQLGIWSNFRRHFVWLKLGQKLEPLNKWFIPMILFINLIRLINRGVQVEMETSASTNQYVSTVPQRGLCIGNSEEQPYKVQPSKKQKHGYLSKKTLF